MASKLSLIAYEHIQRQLITEQLPLGIKVSEQRLARQLGISRTPVREAIRRLQSEGILYQVPSSGTFLAQPNRSQLIEAYEVRELLECRAVGKAARLMNSQQRIGLTESLKKMRTAIRAFRDTGEQFLDGQLLCDFLTADLAFHLLLLKAAGNQLAIKIVTDVHMRNRVYGYRTHRRDLSHLSSVLLLHARITRAVHNRDARAARHWMRHHVRSSLRDVIAANEKHLSWQMADNSAPVGMAEAMDLLVERIISTSNGAT